MDFITLANFKYPLYLSSKIGRTTREKKPEEMDGSSQEGDVKKKVTEIKTFPVPFALGEIKTNITINTNSPSKPSKEQKINKGPV